MEVEEFAEKFASMANLPKYKSGLKKIAEDYYEEALYEDDDSDTMEEVATDIQNLLANEPNLNEKSSELLNSFFDLISEQT